jgi:hypothetical protein
MRMPDDHCSPASQQIIAEIVARMEELSPLEQDEEVIIAWTVQHKILKWVIVFLLFAIVLISSLAAASLADQPGAGFAVFLLCVTATLAFVGLLWFAARRK